MKSSHIAGAAIGTTIAMLGGMAAFAPNADRVVGLSYDRALTSIAAIRPSFEMAQMGSGNEDYWLTVGGRAGKVDLTPAVASAASDVPSIEAIKSAIATGGGFETTKVDILSVQPVARAAIGTSVPSGNKSYLVTARFEGFNAQATRFISVVIDVAPDATHSKARTL